MAWLVSLCSRSGSRSHLIIQALLHFSPHYIFFSLKFPHTHSPSHLAHTPRYLICGLGRQTVALRFGSQSFRCHRGGRGCRASTTQASMRAGSQFPACLAHPSETWDVLTLGWETFPTWKDSYATFHIHLPSVLQWQWKCCCSVRSRLYDFFTV